ncbi:NADH-quinone oxidoreductase subunit NuoH [Metallosphaera javensis (ex Sakai et al. 2022)]|uniref:NADH-quinone oxidoreductase subunit NuoH n=1 Tax=Metallosphaera javensis (ex Sakai et al. 2022) TaxID=2775498 RepID=UPI00258A3E67|nr:MAG: F(420)H(2) dehydrogenase subunit H [Metallosphaera javensis (ex Sakai et al. 2022)]
MNILFDIRYYILYPSFFAPIILPGLIFTAILLLTTIWFERKAAARVQMRVGPYYASKRLGGYLQLVADALKFVFSEVIVPDGVNPTLFALTPVLVVAMSFLPLAVIPVSVIPPSGSIFSIYFYDFYDPNVGLGVLVGLFTQYNMLLILAIESIYPAMIILMAWSTNNRFAIVGAVRESYLSVSYDVLLLMSTISMALEYHTLDLVKIVQSGVPGILANPLAAVTFFIAMIIGSARFPFDIAEADTELVLGPATEYSGLLFVLTMAGSYVGNFVYALVFTDMFLWGWYPLSGFPGALLTVIKASILVFFSVFLRSVYGRYRLDQALRGSWKYIFPLAIASMFLGLVVGYLWIQ